MNLWIKWVIIPGYESISWKILTLSVGNLNLAGFSEVFRPPCLFMAINSSDGHLYNSSYQITMHTEWMPVVERTNNLNQSLLILLILINILQSCCPRPSLKIASNDFQLGSWRDGFTSHDCMKYQQHNYLGDSTRCTAHRWEHTPPSQMVKAVGWKNKTAGDKN